MTPLCVPCLRAIIGDWIYYSALMTASDIVSRVKPAKDIRESKSLDDFLQRALKDRKKDIAKYLLTHDSRFFNSIVVGVFAGVPNWYQLDLSHSVKRFRIPETKSVDDSLGLLVFHGEEKMFAIDGQHRVEGIKIAYREKAAAVKTDQYSVIFVAHVDDKEGKVRTRRLFSDINKRAIPVSNGDKVIIDEDDLSALVSRRIYANYKPFKGGTLISLTEKEKLDENDVEHFTNLLTLYAVSKKLRKLFTRVRGQPEYASQNVEQFLKIVESFFDFMIRHVQAYNSFFTKNSPTLEMQRKNNRNILFRPIGLGLLAKLYVHFYKKEALEQLSKGLSMLRFESPGGLFDNILWNAGRIEARNENQTAAFSLSLYVLNQLNAKDARNLRTKLRIITKDSRYTLPKALA